MTPHLDPRTRRRFLADLGLGAAAAPFVIGLPSVTGAAVDPAPRRLIVVFSPNGTLPDAFWPDKAGAITELKPILKPLEKFRDSLTTVQGLANRVGGDGDNHMRGMSCLLTGERLFPGNIQGGSHTPAGWAKGISIDQEIRNFLQTRDDTRTRFGSLEFGVAVPDRSDPWTRMVYAGPNKPVAPIDDPRRMLDKLYGDTKDAESLLSIVDGVKDDLRRVSGKLSPEDRRMLDEHLALVAQMEKELAAADTDDPLNHPVPQVDPHIELVNDNTPRISRIQIDLLVNSFANNMARVGSLQYMRSVGQARMNWLGVPDGHHALSHEPDNNKAARAKLLKINVWFAGELAYLAQKLRDTPEPGGAPGNMLDNTLIVWTNELGKGNSHTLNDIPTVLLGGKNMGIPGGRAIKVPRGTAHNRFLITLAHAMGHNIKSFGMQNLATGGPIALG